MEIKTLADVKETHSNLIEQSSMQTVKYEEAIGGKEKDMDFPN